MAVLSCHSATSLVPHAANFVVFGFDFNPTDMLKTAKLLVSLCAALAFALCPSVPVFRYLVLATALCSFFLFIGS